MFRWLFMGLGIALVSSSVTLIADRSGVLDAYLPKLSGAGLQAGENAPSQTADNTAQAPEDAKPVPPNGAFDPAMIRQGMAPRIDDGKYDIIAQALDAYTKAPEDEVIGYRAQRAVFGLFAVSSPAVDKTTADWLKADPESPYALTARGWYLWHMGTLMRGDDWPAATSPGAMRQANALFAEAAANAASALKKMPDLLGASDLLIQSAMYVPTERTVPEIIDAVMKVKPNRGTLARGAIALAPKWLGHGKTDLLLALCDAHARQVTAVPNYSVDVCRADLYYSADVGPGFAAPKIPDSGSWVLTKAKAMQALATRDTSPAGQKALEHYLFDQDVADISAAQFLDSAFYAKAQRPLVSFDVYSRLLSQSFAAMVRDPLNMRLIEISSVLLPPVQGQPQRKLPVGVAPDALFATYRKTLDAAPFSASVWRHLAQNVGSVSRKADAATDFYRNSLAYSNNSPAFAASYAVDLAMTATMTAERLNKTQQCDFVRAVRLYQAQCPNGGDGSKYCRMGFDAESWEAIKADIQGSGACEEVFSADPKDLAFEPEKINWSEYGG